MFDPIGLLDDKGRPWRLEYLSALVGKMTLKSGIEKTGGCHLFYHSCGTHMLEYRDFSRQRSEQHGTDIRHVQEQLGHASLQTTQVYAQVSLIKLKEAHARSHPSSRSD